MAKIIKIGVRSLLILLLIIGGLTILLRNESVQTKIAKKASDYLSNELSSEVSIQAVAIDFSRNISFSNLLIRDRFGDSMIFASNFNTQLLSWDWNKRMLIFNNSSLYKGLVYLGKRKDSSGLNIDFLVDYINGSKKEKKEKSNPWNVYFSQAKLAQVNFKYFNQNKEKTPLGIIDPQNLAFNNISGVAKELWLIKDSLHFITENLSTTEKSGLIISSFDAVCNIHNKGMDFTELICQTECSTIGNELHFSYPGYKYLDEFISNTTWTGYLRDTRLCLKELKIFDPFFKHNRETALINTELSGTFDNLRAKNFDARLAQSTIIKGDFRFKGLPRWRNSIQQFNINTLSSTGSDISSIMSGMAMPKALFDLGNLKYNGKLNGKFLNFRTEGIFRTDAGIIALNDVKLNIEDGLEAGTLSGNIATENFNIGSFAQGVEIGAAAINGRIEAQNITNNIQLHFDGSLPSIEYKKSIFTNVLVNGTVNKEQFNGQIKSEDPNLGLSYDGILAFGKKNPEWQFNVKLKGLNLAKLGLDELGETLWADANIDLSGGSIQALRGDLLLDNVQIIRKGKRYNYKTISVSKKKYRDGSRTEMYGDLADAEIVGNVDIAQLGNIIQHSLHQIFPDKFEESPTDSDANFNFFVNIKKPEYFESFIDENLRTNQIKAKGTFIEEKGILLLESQPFEISYKDFKVNNLSIDLHKRNASSVEFGINGFEILKNGVEILQSTEINGIAEDGNTVISSRIVDKSGNNQLDFTGSAHLFKDSTPIKISQTRLKIDKHYWNLSEMGELNLTKDHLFCKNFFLAGENNYIEASGYFGYKKTDTAFIDFSNLDMDFLRPFLAGTDALDSLNLKLNGRLRLLSALDVPSIKGETYIKDLSFKNTNYGDLNISFEETLIEKDIGVLMSGINGSFKGLHLSGTIDPKNTKGNMFKLGLTIPKTTQATVLQPILKGIVTLEDGTLGGWVKLRGNPSEPELTGTIDLDSCSFMVDYLKTRYALTGTFFANKQGLFTKERILITDEEKNGTALAEMALTHSNFKDLYLNLDISKAQNLKCLNTQETDNDLFFGTGYANGSCKIYGPVNAIDMDIRLKTQKGTSIYLPYTETEINKVAGFVKFKEKQGQKVIAKEKSQNSLNRINIEIESNPETDVYFVIDKQLGDVIKGSGSGLLRMLYDENQNFYLNGTYTIDQGVYAFSLPGINLVTRKINLDKGGQITWTGDPYKANLNLTGSFTKKLSPSVLMPPGSGNYPPITVISKLSLTGDLFKPSISFDLESPDLNSSDGGSGLLSSTFSRIRADPNERMRQAVWLLVFGNFVPPSNLSAAPAVGSINGIGVAGNSLGALVSNQANNIANQFGLPTQFQLNLDNVGAASTTETTTSIYVNSETRLTDKIKLNLNFDNTVSTSSNGGVNFNLEYTPENSLWRMRLFSRNQNSLSSLNNVNISTVSGYTLGSGFIFQMEFDRFKRRKKKRKKGIQ